MENLLVGILILGRGIHRGEGLHHSLFPQDCQLVLLAVGRGFSVLVVNVHLEDLVHVVGVTNGLVLLSLAFVLSAQPLVVDVLDRVALLEVPHRILL